MVNLVLGKWVNRGEIVTIGPRHSGLSKRQHQCLARSMGKIGQKDFGESGGLNEILEEHYVIDRWTG